jgi:hypothetical chaperone protein
MKKAIGLDFGTSNSAIAVVSDQDEASLAVFRDEDGLPTHTFRSILYFSGDRKGKDGRALAVGGPEAIATYLDRDGNGRLIQSLKSFLANRSFTDTNVYGRNYKLDDLIAIFLRKIKEAAERQFGDLGRKVIVGRPVRFADANTDEDEALALVRLRSALEKAGFDDITFEFEPVAAAYQYDRQLQKDELTLIGDFGGGTSDFSLIRLGPSYRKSKNKYDCILGNNGVGLAGNAFDGEIVQHVIAPKLGRGTEYISMGKRLPMPSWIYKHLANWHHVSFLKEPKTIGILAQIRPYSLEPEKIDALIHIIKSDLGYKLYRSIESLKVDLSKQESSVLRFEDLPVEITENVLRRDFEAWIHEKLQKIEDCIDSLLKQCSVDPKQVDSVFLTGGSAFVPSVRKIFERKFGAERLRGGEELTTVARGLALRALAE